MTGQQIGLSGHRIIGRRNRVEHFWLSFTCARHVAARCTKPSQGGGI